MKTEGSAARAAKVVSTQATGPKIGETVERFELENAWLVDPVSGREGPGEIVVTDGILESVVWLEGPEADGVTDKGVVVAPGFLDLHAHFREPGFEDAENIATGAAAAAHGGFALRGVVAGRMAGDVYVGPRRDAQPVPHGRRRAQRAATDARDGAGGSGHAEHSCGRAMELLRAVRQERRTADVPHPAERR